MWFEQEQGYRIFSVKKPGLALMWDSNDGDNVVGYDVTSGGYSDSFWEVMDNGAGFYSFKNKLSGKNGESMMLDLSNFGTASGTNVQVGSRWANGKVSQIWKLIPFS